MLLIQHKWLIYKKTNEKFWIYDDALESYIENNDGSIDQGLSAFAQELDHFSDTETGKSWKKNWKVCL
jgi:hypothetical protein